MYMYMIYDKWYMVYVNMYVYVYVFIFTHAYIHDELCGEPWWATISLLNHGKVLSCKDSHFIVGDLPRWKLPTLAAYWTIGCQWLSACDRIHGNPWNRMTSPRTCSSGCLCNLLCWELPLRWGSRQETHAGGMSGQQLAWSIFSHHMSYVET